MSNWATPYARVLTKSATFTALLSEKPDGYLITAATVPVAATLFDPAGQFGGFASGFGQIRIINSASSRNIVTIATAAGSIVGNTTLYPGQSATFMSDGYSVWYQVNPQGSLGILSTSLSAAQIIAMNGTPVELVPSPGTGKIILVHSIEMTIVRTSTAFTGGGAVEYRYTGASGAKVSADMSSSLITGSAGTAYASVAGVATELTPVPAVGIYITNATAVFAAGTGVATVNVMYRVVT